MTLLGLIFATLAWLITLIPTFGIIFANAMMLDAGGVDRVWDTLVVLSTSTCALYLVVVPISLVIAWIAYFVGNHLWAQRALFVPLIHIGIYIVIVFLVFLRNPAWWGIG